MKSLNEILTKEYLERLETLSITLQGKLSFNGYSGARKSRAKGSSLEFSDYREYVSGDDLRRVDWNSYGRFERLYTKLFMEEKQAVINIFLDSSQSMEDGEKYSYAKALAASLAYIALKDADKVNLFSWGDGLQEKKLNTRSKNMFVTVVQFLDGLESRGKTRLTKAVSESLGMNAGRGISVIISDFFSEDGWEEAVKRLQYQKQEVLLIWVLSPEEEKPSQRGAVQLIDRETGQTLDVEITQGVLAAYEKARDGYEAQLRNFCKKRGVGFVKLSEKTPLLKGIYEVL